jgi:hypothetical protein
MTGCCANACPAQRLARAKTICVACFVRILAPDRWDVSVYAIRAESEF